MNDELTTRLREHDPARGKSLADFDRTRILRRALSAKRRTPLRLAAAVAILMILIIGATTMFRRTTSVSQHAAVRQVQYTAPGGTRILWTLDPNFHM